MLTNSLYSRTSYLLLPLLITAFVSCKVTLIAPYDEITDKVVTEMQETTSTFFVKLESEPDNAELKYENQKKFYQQLKVKAATVRIRNSAIDKNKIIISMINELEANIGRLETLHKGKTNGLLLPEEVQLLKGAFETQYGAIIKFLMALKQRGKAE